MARPQTTDERHRRENEGEIYAENGPRNTEITYRELTEGNPYVSRGIRALRQRAANDNEGGGQNIITRSGGDRRGRGRRGVLRTQRRPRSAVSRFARVGKGLAKTLGSTSILLPLYFIQLFFSVFGLLALATMMAEADNNVLVAGASGFLDIFGIGPRAWLYASMMMGMALGFFYLLLFFGFFTRATLRMLKSGWGGWFILMLIVPLCTFPAINIWPWSFTYALKLSFQK